MVKEESLKCVVPSYEIEGSEYAEILRKARKGNISWHYPTHIVKLLMNPLPLFIFDEIFIDKAAFEGHWRFWRERMNWVLSRHFLKKLETCRR